ncbi:hypothetical protein [Nocardia cyriacigeorgica]|uniref:hypothetical protein n=1 Tax=Nocardia cyriacigeorgica TaxID=135487 RepID=UPI002454CCB6|nr:hypothetical protein [Nocardia cyriacigeorgica]
MTSGGSNSHAKLVSELIEVRGNGIGSSLRDLALPQLAGVIQLVLDDPHREVIPADIESLLRQAVERISGEKTPQRHALEALFGLSKSMRMEKYPARRRKAADELGISFETFRRKDGPETELTEEVATSIEAIVRASLDQHRLLEIDAEVSAKAKTDAEEEARRRGARDRARRRHRGTFLGRLRRRIGAPGRVVPYILAISVVLAVGAYATNFHDVRQMLMFGSESGTQAHGTEATSSVEVTQAHECRPPNLSEVKLPDVEVCVVRWCMAPIKDQAGNSIPNRSQVKIRARVLNNSAEALDLSSSNPSAMRLLVSGSTLPGSWEPFPRTAAQGDAPVLVEYDGQRYWAIPANISGDVDQINLPGGGVTWNGFVGSWDAGVIAPGQPYYKPLRPGPNGRIVQEGNLVFNVPADQGIYIKALAVVDKENPARVIAAWSSDKWPASVDPNEF